MGFERPQPVLLNVPRTLCKQHYAGSARSGTACAVSTHVETSGEESRGYCFSVRLGLPVSVFAIIQRQDSTANNVSIGALAMGRMITMSINRVGTIPIPDMTFHIAIVYIFGVSEVNIAIAAASIPIFWPIIVTLAANKIFVVNEIEVVVERVSGDTYGTGKALDKGEGQNILREQSGRMMTITKKFDCRPSKSSHGHKSSTTSSLGRALGHRPNQDSQRYLYRAASNDLGSARSLSRNEGNDWISDMNKMSHGTTTTTVQRTDIPLEQMKAFDQR